MPVGNRVFVGTVFQCPRGELDIARLFAYFRLNGWSITDNLSEADLVVVGGCAFTLSVEDQSIHELAAIRQAMKPGAPLLVGGCIAGIQAARIKEAVDATPTDIVGGKHLDELISARVPLKSVDDANSLNYASDEAVRIAGDERNTDSCAVASPVGSLLRFTRWFRFGKPQDDINPQREKVFYIRVARGCLDDCTYCAIKTASGNIRSKPVDVIRREFERGLSDGHRLFYLLGEDVGAFGQDQGKSIVDLLKSLLSVEGDYQLVISDCNPRWFVQYRAELLDLLTINSNRVKQLELPMQSGNDKTLARMGRQYTVGDVEDCVLALREAAPSIRLKTHVMVGFPGETKNDFHDTLEFAKRVNFHCIASYIYSDRPGTHASKLPNKVPTLVKALRHWRFNREVL